MSIKSKEELLAQVCDRFNTEIPKRVGHPQLPSKLGITLKDDCLRLHLDAELTHNNLQEDNSAFEGWAFVLRRWVKKMPVVLSWDAPNGRVISRTDDQLTTAGKHYQRFLYRVKRMQENYDWFTVGKHSGKELEKLQIVNSETYFLNGPDSKGASSCELTNANISTEALIERSIVEKKATMLQDTGLDQLFFQLPVGVFKETVSKKNAVFTGGKSAIDLWGVNTKTKQLAIFELKDDKNRKVGIISEIMFYASVIMDTRIPNPIFQYQLKSKIEPTRGTTEAFDVMKNPAEFSAYLLAPRFHPLIDQRLVDDMNLRTNKNSGVLTYKMLTLQEEYHPSSLLKDK